MTELELKFGLEKAATERWRHQLQQGDAPRERFRARYVDTPDSVLARCGIALRLRQEGRRWVQTLKVQDGHQIERLEHEVVLSTTGDDWPTWDLSLHAGTAAGDRLAHALRGREVELAARYETDVWRMHQHITTASGCEIEIALDEGEVRAGEVSDRIEEIEFEHKGGPVQGLFDFAVDAVADGGLWLSTMTKAERGERLRAGPSQAGHGECRAVKAQAMVLAADADGPQLLRAVLRNVVAQVLPNASAVAAGSDDADVIHQLRVGLRRLRTALRELAGLSTALQAAWAAPLGRAFGRLGERRDNESVAAAVAPLLVEAGAPKTAWALPPAVDTAAAVRDPAFQATLVRILALAYAPVDQLAPLSNDDLRRLLAKRLRKLHRRVTRDGRDIDRLPAEAQHRVRKRLKRLRYLAEFAAPLWPRKRVDRYLEALKPAQTALGQHNDTVVAAARFEADARNDPSALFAAGFLRAHQQRTARRARKALKPVARARPFW